MRNIPILATVAVLVGFTALQSQSTAEHPTPTENSFTIAVLPDGNKQQTLFVNGAKIGSVEFSGEPLTWQTHMFSAHLEKGPNSIVLRKADGAIHIDSLQIGRGEGYRSPFTDP